VGKGRPFALGWVVVELSEGACRKGKGLSEQVNGGFVSQ